MLRLSLLVGGALAADPLGPGKGPWEVETPESHGLKTEAIKEAWEYMLSKSGGVIRPTTRDCLVIIKDGALVYEAYSSDEYNVTAHRGYSATKTLGALVAGWSVTHSKLDIDADITSTYGVKSPKPYPVTSRQIMSQAVAGDDGPGEAWKYDASGLKWINTLAEVIPAATGQKTSQIWKEQFHEPLGMSDTFTWAHPDLMWASGSSGTCRDFARVGQLMLNKGHWKGVESPIVSEDYIHQMSIPETQYKPYTNYSNPCYGLLTWLNTRYNDDPNYPGGCVGPEGTADPASGFPSASPKDLFFAAGLYGQIVMVMPSHNAVAVSMGLTVGQNGVASDMYKGFCKSKVFEDCGAEDSVLV